MEPRVEALLRKPLNPLLALELSGAKVGERPAFQGWGLERVLGVVDGKLECWRLKTLGLARLDLGGTIPDPIGNYCVKLELLQVHYNKLEGATPQSLNGVSESQS